MKRIIVKRWIPDEEFLNNKLLRNSSSGMTSFTANKMNMKNITEGI